MNRLLPFQLITEITRPASIQSAMEKLRPLGWRQVGAGVFGKVLVNPRKDYVLKLFTADDQVYRQYLDLVKEHQDNPHIPKLRGLPIKVTPNYYAIRMEKLSPMQVGANNDHAEDLKYIKQYVVGAQQMAEHIKDRKRGQWGIGDKDIEDDKKMIMNLMNKHPDMPELLEKIKKYVIKAVPGSRFDLHDGNIMYRGKVPVITDPVAWGDHAIEKVPEWNIRQYMLPFDKKPEAPKPKEEPAWKKRAAEIQKPQTHMGFASLQRAKQADDFRQKQAALASSPGHQRQVVRWGGVNKRRSQIFAKPASQANQALGKHILGKARKGKNKIMYDMLIRSKGATMEEILAATGWRQVSVAGVAHMMGLTVRRVKERGPNGRKQTRYFASPKIKAAA